MVVILSTSIDRSTTIVTEWLSCWQLDYVRINIDELCSFLPERDEALARLISGEIRYHLWVRTNNPPFRYSNRTEAERRLFHAAYSEAISTTVYLLGKRAQQCLGLNFMEGFVFSKLEMLEQAKSAGLAVPEYLISNRRDDVLAFLKQQHRIVVKNCFELFSFPDDTGVYKSLATELNNTDLETLGPFFGMSFFQQLIPKLFDVKIAFVAGQLFPVALHTTNAGYTAIDYRNYVESRIRLSALEIPDYLQTQIRTLFERLKLNFGVIDFVADQHQQYYFMELNPYGQFLDLSNCYNQQIEKTIASWFLTAEKETVISTSCR